MRRRQINLMRAAVAPVAAHPSAPVEHPQQPAAVSVPPAPPPAPITFAEVGMRRMDYVGEPVMVEVVGQGGGVGTYASKRRKRNG